MTEEAGLELVVGVAALTYNRGGRAVRVVWDTVRDAATLPCREEVDGRDFRVGRGASRGDGDGVAEREGVRCGVDVIKPRL